MSNKKYNLSLLDEGIKLIEEETVINWSEIFKNSNDLVLEIGCGNGHFLTKKAVESPENNFIGIDIKHERVSKGIEKQINANLNNVKFFVDEGLHFITTYFQDSSLSLVYLLFPDPWPKRKHHKHRLLLKESFIDALYKKLKDGGTFIYVTDHEEYFKASYERFLNEKRFVLQNKTDNEEYSISIFGKKWKEEGRRFYSFTLCKLPLDE
ncbi:MAG TPA: tRNA (guanosine(46)-N7)-methyltransferase TrmB [Spirochaetota bacterium]|nr:tRNA (guanosine(46)-N7)-methyltransferase TrmB [Spirochaetota bacterium]